MERRSLLPLLLLANGCSCSDSSSGPSLQDSSPESSLPAQSEVAAGTVWMDPEPLSTRIPLTTSMVLTIDVEKAVPAGDIEEGFSVSTFGGPALPVTTIVGEKAIGAPIPEAYVVRTLTIKVVNGLSPDLDYLLGVRPVRAFRPKAAFLPGGAGAPRLDGSFVTAIATGSRPRLSSVRLGSKDGGKTVQSLRLRFSEPVLQGTVFAGFALSSAGAAADGLFVEPHPMYQERVQEVQDFEFRPRLGIDSGRRLLLRFSGVKTQAGVPMQAWPGDRSGAVTIAPGAVEVSLDTAQLPPVGGGWLWVPAW